jgi:hypothetical protein
MMYPPEPVSLTHWPQLDGLENGDFVAQRSYVDARRAVKLPGEGLFYRTGRRVDKRPWRDLVVPEVRIPLDLLLLRECSHVLDVIMPVSFPERVATARAWGVIIEYVPVFSVDDVNELLFASLGTGDCDGVVLKRTSERYPWSPLRAESLPGWLKVKRALAKRGGNVQR